MNELDWFKELPASVTVCDETGFILEMNDKAAQMYEKEGGRKLIGSNILDCHPEPARTKTEALMAAQQQNIYTIERTASKN